MDKKEHILIVGAGLCGSLLALRLGQRGFRVTLVEKRPDLREVEQDSGRSINLALSDRGLKGLRMAGVEDQALKLCIPMHGRMIHPEGGGEPFLSPYSGNSKKYINSISRPGLNALLLDQLEGMEHVRVQFNQSCTAVDLQAAKASFKDNHSGQTMELQGDILIGTDGAGSVVRKAMFNQREYLFSFSQQWLSHGYKELEIPPAADGGYRMDKGALHIWPRGEDMLIALPNLDGSFTVTLFIPYQSEDFGFNTLKTPADVQAYFRQEYPDTLELIPDLTEQFFQNPTGPLGTIKCYPWSGFGKSLIMGDAAHAVVPFYGQGMNASFEDVVVLDQLLDRYQEDWKQVLPAYQQERKADTDAIADLAVDNFDEMKAHTANPLFQRKRKVEIALEQHPELDYQSKYSLVTFNADLSYGQAMKQGRMQDKALLNLLADGRLSGDEPLDAQLEKIQKTTEELLQDDAVVKNL